MKLRPRILLASAILLALCPLAVSAKDSAKELPKARTLMDAHINAIGGAKAVEASSDGTAKAVFEIVELGIKGDMTISQRDEDFVMTLSLPGIGETRLGIIDGVTWSIDPQNGPRLLEGKERERLAQQNDDKYNMRDSGLIASATTTALTDSEGRPCYRVDIEWKSGEKTADCYGVDDGLLLYTESMSASPMGELTQIAHMYDYKQVGKTKAPQKVKNKIAGMTQAITMTSFDESKPSDDLFVLPAAIDALVKKQGPASQTAE
jgi:hypothetical protein